MVKADWIKPGAVVIDVGINSLDDETSKKGWVLPSGGCVFSFSLSPLFFIVSTKTLLRFRKYFFMPPEIYAREGSIKISPINSDRTLPNVHSNFNSRPHWFAARSMWASRPTPSWSTSRPKRGGCLTILALILGTDLQTETYN